LTSRAAVVLRSSETKKLVRSDEQAKTTVDATEEAVKARLAAAGNLSDYRSQVAKQMESDLEELLGALREAGGGQ
jgi:DNA repair ATPase RecN